MFKYDNPKGRWLEEKIASAERRLCVAERGIAAKGLVGGVTAWTAGAVMIDTDVARRLIGVNNEQRRPGDHQYDGLTASVDTHGWDARQLNNAIMIGVNHLGDAFIIEGNTRAAYAHAHGIPQLRAEIRWYNGGEEADGVFCLRDKDLPFCAPDETSAPETETDWF